MGPTSNREEKGRGRERRGGRERERKGRRGNRWDRPPYANSCVRPADNSPRKLMVS